jgi:hypothetical protein
VKILLVFIFFLFAVSTTLVAQPQAITINVVELSLNKVLLGLSEKYGIQIAFDDRLLSHYRISATRQFNSIDEALVFLFHDLPLRIEKSGEVYLIVPEHGEPPKKKSLISVVGQVVEAESYEPLPFSSILVNNKQIEADQTGNFTFLASADSSYFLRISHLGYYIYDTVFTNSFNRKFQLQPSVTSLGEVKIVNHIIEKSTQIGDQPGEIKLNHTIAPYLPGYGDNSVFNLLRLMPGILASGEQSNDLIMWGSYESQSKVEFDGFTLFGLKNFNDNIGVVNPLVVKDMEVLKGGYEAKYGDRVGGIVNITGKNGTLKKPSFTFNINNTTLNSMLEIPLSGKSSLLVAYRQTYYELYDPSQIKLFDRNGKNKSGIDVTLTPDYTFRDANIKYSYQGTNSAINFSLYGGGDRYSYNIEKELVNTKITREEQERNRQSGGAFIWNFKWRGGNTGKFQTGFSTFSGISDELNKTTNIRTGHEKILKIGSGENSVKQLTISEENRINFINGHYLEFGAGLEANNVILIRNLFSDELINIDTRSPRAFFYGEDNLPVNSFLELKAGMRISYLFNLKKTYAEPRLSASVKISEKMKLNLSWGMFHQYLSKTSFVDSSLNVYYFWANSDNRNIPIQKGQHWVAGFSYNKNGFTADLEGYYKNTDGIARFVNGTQTLKQGFYNGEGRSYGLDFYLKKEYKGLLAWMCYSLSKTEEHFPFNVREYYHPAPQDQRHELKFAAIYNLKAFYFSANYVYGSGFERFILTDNTGQEYIPPYSRLDAAVIYKFKPGKINCETGISVLNVFNTQNIKLSNLRRVATDTENPLDVNAEAVPFTPTLFLKIKL